MATLIDEKSALAIVVPFYKVDYFQDLLEALKNQTNQDFCVYVGDDCSPNDPQEIIERYKDVLNISYLRFEQNLGAVSLAKQWNRCLEMVGDETWVWVVPDDDIPAKECVAAFYNALPAAEENRVKVFRFSYKLIDENGTVTNDLQFEEPELEDNLAYYNRLMRGKTASSLGDNIFHKESLVGTGGFVDFPKAWGSDHATVLRAASGGQLRYLADATLYFRISGKNISSDTSDGVEKLKARIQFARWLQNNEHIFPVRPDREFYRYFYWKAEYYVLNVWIVSLPLLGALYRLRKICMNSGNVWPIVKIFLLKLGRATG